MNHTDTSSLVRAVAASLFLHAAVIAFGAQLTSALPKIVRPAATKLSVRLAEPVFVPAPQPQLSLPKDNPAEAAKPVRKPETRARKPAPQPVPAALSVPRAQDSAPRAAGPQTLVGVAARRANEQIARELFYPPEAIERGLEGEVLVLLFLDAGGNAIAARVESSSGHAILDNAAVRAARTLRSLPESAAREALVPVRFRLR